MQIIQMNILSILSFLKLNKKDRIMQDMEQSLPIISLKLNTLISLIKLSKF